MIKISKSNVILSSAAEQVHIDDKGIINVVVIGKSESVNINFSNEKFMEYAKEKVRKWITYGDEDVDLDLTYETISSEALKQFFGDLLNELNKLNDSIDILEYLKENKDYIIKDRRNSINKVSIYETLFKKLFKAISLFGLDDEHVKNLYDGIFKFCKENDFLYELKNRLYSYLKSLLFNFNTYNRKTNFYLFKNIINNMNITLLDLEKEHCSCKGFGFSEILEAIFIYGDVDFFKFYIENRDGYIYKKEKDFFEENCGKRLKEDYIKIYYHRWVKNENRLSDENFKGVK